MAKQIRLFVLVAAIFWSTAILFAQEQAPAPVHKEGDTWQFNIFRKGQIGTSTDQIEGMYEVSVTQGVVKLYQVDGGQKIEKPIEPDGPTETFVRLIGKSETQRPTLKFPLSVGQTWTYQYETRPPGSKFNQRRSAEVNVVGMEQVTTPAGSFKAYKLIRSESWTVGSRFGQRGGSTSTYFYSPETRSIVRTSNVSENSPGTLETELIKFTPGN
jgi:hypothetical protein